MIDVTELSDADLDDLYVAVNAEVGRRRTLKAIPDQIADLNRAYQSSSGYIDGQPWQQPQGVVGAYMTGDHVLHDGSEWLSLIDYNVYEPGDLADPQAYRWWENLDHAEDDNAWQPGVAYETGQEVTYDGRTWECVQGHTSQPDWTPDKTPSLWQPVEGT